MSCYCRYKGNNPGNVSKSAKYSVVHGSGEEMRIQLIYPLDRREIAILATERHPDLVDMVNHVKEEQQGSPGGAFYINEFRQVLAPVREEDSLVYMLAGEYDDTLEFAFEGAIISGRAPQGLRPMSPWLGPKVGIPYVITANGDDIYYEWSPSAQRVKKEHLSDHLGESAARSLVKRLTGGGFIKAGRIYINEEREFFKADADGEGTPYYLGNLGEDDWYPKGTCWED